MQRIVALLTSGAAVGVAACADLRWENSNIPEEHWATDRQVCIAAAHSDSRQRYDDSFLTRETHLQGVEGDLARARQSELRHRQTAYAQDAFERCMKDKGYERVVSPR